MMSSESASDGYQVYLLRLWRARCQGRWEWRACIESPDTGERQWFANLDQLSIHLREQCERHVPGASEMGRQRDRELMP